MQLSDQICSLELAKRLKELGVKQDSLFYYQNNPYNNGKDCIDLMIKEWRDENGENVIMNSEYGNDDHPKYPAFTVSELGEMLPNCMFKPELAPFDNYGLSIKKFISVDEKMNHTNNFTINYECDSTEMQGAEAWLTRKFSINIYDPNLSNALAKMLIYLLENGLLKNE